jgi:predicted TIM-barrel fold metal-dependent hydrolase
VSAASGELIDWHTHIWRPEQLGPQWGPRLDAVLAPARPSQMADYEQHGEAMRTAGVEKFGLIGLTIEQIGMHVPNDYIAEYFHANRHRAIGVASVDPRRPGAVEEIRRAVNELGLQGLKLSPPYSGYHPHSDEAWAVYEAAAELGIFLMFHQGGVFIPSGSLEYGQPVLLDRVARAFPDTPLWIAHMGKPWTFEVVELMTKNPNVWTDISALAARPSQLLPALQQAVEYHVTDRILFGSDFPVADPAWCVERVRALADLDVPFPVSLELLDDIIYNRPFELLVG